LAYIDIDTWLLPHQITWPLLAVGLVSPLWNREVGWNSSLIGAGAGFALFAAIALVGERILKRETMGWGDVWLLAAIGAWLGWPSLLPVVMLSALQGSVVGIALILLGRAPAAQEPAQAPSPDDDWVPPKHAVPYGPFLSLAAGGWCGRPVRRGWRAKRKNWCFAIRSCRMRRSSCGRISRPCASSSPLSTRSSCSRCCSSSPCWWRWRSGCWSAAWCAGWRR